MNTETIKDTIKSPKNIKDNMSKMLDKGDTSEGRVTTMVENQTGKLPSITWLGLAVGSMAASAVLLVSAERKEFANFVGLWAPSFLLIGVYNKLVKLEGNDKHSHGGQASFNA